MTIKDIVFVYHLKDESLLDWHSRVHSHSGTLFEIHYFLSGSGRFKNGDSVRRIQKGQLFLTRPDVVHGIQPDDMADPLTYYAVLFELRRSDLPQLDLGADDLLRRFPLLIGSGYRLRFEEMKNRYNSRNPWYKEGSQFELLAFLLDLMGRLYEDDTEPVADRDAHSSVYVEQAMDLFQKHVFETTTLPRVAQALRISPEYLIKVFRRHIGITPMRYYQNLRLEASVSLLLNSQLSIKEIADRLDFANQFHFSRNFKAFAGLSPSAYRDQYFADNPTRYHTRIVGG